MKFFIRNTENLDYDFLKLIPVEMQKLFIECADENKLNAINKYFNDVKFDLILYSTLFGMIFKIIMYFI